jgi:hypothetical protein
MFAGIHTAKSLPDIVARIVSVKGSCQIADLGSAYWGSFGCFKLASETVQIDAVDVIFSGDHLPGESPTASPNPTNEHVSPFINLIGDRIEVFLQQKVRENASYDVILYKDVYSTRLDIPSSLLLLGQDGVLIVGNYNGHQSLGHRSLDAYDIVRKMHILHENYRGFSRYWELANGFAMSRGELLNSAYPIGFVDFFFGNDEQPM